ncbi:hypothetical protein [Roseivirga misakiensis]|uniref:Uncharacterized protein n=1 Tax=Roseivirga misakiensis TaxID=1563681 RepID=A0A1E5SZ40_9BACT|nr:hypothetical protein [Roseivirga misakiensis]OEK04398.1 hypothetical protein BFP71_13030 [Roseivirga misakiensis]
MSDQNKNRFSKSDIASALALVMSIAALGIGIIEAKIMADQQEIMADQQRVMVEQQKGSVWPYVALENSLDYQADSLVISWIAENKGVGPAIVNSIDLKINEQPYNTFNALLAHMDSVMGNDKYTLTKFGVSKKTESVYAPGEKKTIFQMTVYDRNLFFEQIGYFNLTLKYCSIYGDCWGQNGSSLENETGE